MPKVKSESREAAFNIFKEYNGKIKLVDIANTLNVPEVTVRAWKSKDHWNEKIGTFGTLQKHKERSKPAEHKKVFDPEEVEINNDLTEKQRLFCMFYVQNFNATAAALKAGYSPESARVIGYENLTKPYIKAEIDRLKALKVKSLLMTENDIVERFMKIAFSDITDFVSFGQKEVQVIGSHGPVFEGEGQDKKSVMQTINYVVLKDCTSVDGSLICEVSQGKDGVKIKLADKIKALEWLSNYFNMKPMDRHRQEYEKKKLEIELLKAEAQLNKTDDGEDCVPDDGFLEALNGSARDTWKDYNTEKGEGEE